MAGNYLQPPAVGQTALTRHGIWSREAESSSERTAGRAGGGAFLCLPAQAEPGKVAQLYGPGDDVGGDDELVVENSGLIHDFPRFLLWISSFPRALRFPGGDILLLAFDIVAQDQNQDAPGQPRQDVPAEGVQHGGVLDAGVRSAAQYCR